MIAYRANRFTNGRPKTTQQKKSGMLLYVMCEFCAPPNRHWMGKYSAYFVFAQKAGLKFNTKIQMPYFHNTRGDAA